jgi:hypothetical protein
MIRKNVIAIEKLSTAFPGYRCIAYWALDFLRIYQQDTMTGRHHERPHAQAKSSTLGTKNRAELLTS